MALDHILIAVDGSPAAKEATSVGLEIAAGIGAEVTFVHGDHALADRLFELNPKSAETREQRVAADPALREAAAAAEARGVQSHVDVVGAEGTHELVPAILGIAAAIGAELIVVGSRGLGPLAGAALGSVSQGLMRHSDVPVVVVHSPRAG